MRDGAAWGSIAIDQDDIRGRVESIDGPPHGEQCRLQDIDGIDDLPLDHAESDGQRFSPDGLVELLASADAEPLGIINPIDDRGWRKDDGGGHYRSCQATTPGLVDTGNELIPCGTKTRFLSCGHRRVPLYVNLRSVIRAAFPFSFRR